LLAADSSKYAAIQSTIEGVYSFADVKPGLYLIAVSFIGYRKTYSESINLTTRPIEVPVIQISPDSRTLNEATVYAKKLS
jgi:hypothetical protein